MCCCHLLPFRNSRASLKAVKGRKHSIHWSNETMRLFSELLPSFLYRLLWLAALKSYSPDIHHFVFSLLKLPPSFKAVFLQRKPSRCLVTMLSHGNPGNVALQVWGGKQFCDCAISLFPYHRVYTRLWPYTVELLQISLRSCFNQREVSNRSGLTLIFFFFTRKNPSPHFQAERFRFQKIWEKLLMSKFK